jgi:tRNA-specific 2-thiouridylase
MNFDKSLININKDPKDIKIVVAMSGGVDSSVVAVMLKKFGYQVIGITLQLYDHGEILKKKNACCAGTDIYDAKKVANQHNFPHYTLNYQNNFKEHVIDDFVNSYLEGSTPIPCVKCNQSVKFGDLLKVAKDLKVDAMATGHYVQRKINQYFQPELHKAIDATKDQSYFLFSTTNEQLDFLRFPLGGFYKEYTRQLAQEFGLEIANKPDSQDICFVPNNDYAQVIRKYRPDSFKIGNIIHIKTQEILVTKLIFLIVLNL